jgi:hypothetical protein
MAGYRTSSSQDSATTQQSQTAEPVKAPAAAAATAAAAPAAEPVKVPRSIHDVDNGKILGFGADLSEDHPVSVRCKIRTNH